MTADKRFTPFLASMRSDSVSDEIKSRVPTTLADSDRIMDDKYFDLTKSKQDGYKLGWKNYETGIPLKTYERVVDRTLDQYTKYLNDIDQAHEKKFVDIPRWVSREVLRIVKRDGFVNLDALKESCKSVFGYVMSDIFMSSVNVGMDHILTGGINNKKTDTGTHPK